MHVSAPQPSPEQAFNVLKMMARRK